MFTVQNFCTIFHIIYLHVAFLKSEYSGLWEVIDGCRFGMLYIV